MAASKFSSCMAMAAAVASLSSTSVGTHADSSFRFPYFSSSPSSSSSHSNPSSSDQTGNAKSGSEASAAEEPRGSGFDPESLERGAKALREINSSPHAKQVYNLSFLFLFDSFCFSDEICESSRKLRFSYFFLIFFFTEEELKCREKCTDQFI